MEISPLRFLKTEMCPFGADDESRNHDRNSTKQFEIGRE